MLPARISRRSVLKSMGVAAATGLTVAVTGSGVGCVGRPTDNEATDWRAWLHIARDGSVTVYSPRLEMGQGILTAMGMLVADELDADWATVTVRHAPLEDRFGTQTTEDSDGVRTNWLLMRTLGATARRQLVQAAAERWNVPAATCATRDGYVRHAGSGREASYGDLAVAAGQLPLPGTVELKPATAFRLLSRAVPRLDLPQMLDGSLTFTADISLPGLLTATILHSPVLGGRVVSVDDRAALAIPGVKQTVVLDNAVAVVADSFWNADQGRRQLQVQWAAPKSPALDDATMWRELEAACQEPGEAIISQGNAPEVLAAGDGLFSQEYSVAYHAHAAMEPMVAIADVRAHSCEVWVPTQSPWAAYREALAHGLSPLDRFLERVHLKLTGNAGNRIRVHSMAMGGAFGRRLVQDVVREAILVSSAVRAPVRLMWTREEDLANDFYRPACQQLIQARLDPAGRLLAWRQRIAGSGILDHGTELPYDCENVRVETSRHAIGVPTGSLRSTSHAPNAFARECFIDELAASAGLDPLAFRLAHLTQAPRMRRVLEAAAERAGWSSPVPAGRARGLAIHPSKGSFIAQVAEVSLTDDGAIRVHRVVCVIDCGFVVNPDTVRAQMEGSIIFGLTACLKNAITVANGQVQQRNFDAFPLLRLREAPTIDIHVLESEDPPGGVGEPGVPPIAPAVANAVFFVSGRRSRALPLRLNQVQPNAVQPEPGP